MAECMINVKDCPELTVLITILTIIFTSLCFQCSQSEKELSDLCCQQTQLTAACLDLLGQYGAVVRLFPSSYLLQHRATLYRHWAQSLIECQSVERYVYSDFDTKLHMAIK